ncbi:MAG: NAD(+) diphosphatase [Bauldia sp.]
MANFFDGSPTHEPSSGNAFARNPIDRRSEERGETSIPTAFADPAARLYLFIGDKAVLKDGSSDPLFPVDAAEALNLRHETLILLGWAATGPRLAATIPDETPLEVRGLRAIDLRALAVEGLVPPEHLGPLAQGRSLSYWHARHGFCSVCGQPSVMKSGGYRRDCPSCKAEHFPRTDPVVIMLAVDGERCLLGRQSRFPPGMYSCLAGFVEPGETIEDAVRRETFEEAGIRLGRVRYHSSQPWPFPASLMIGCHGEALNRDIVPDERELEDCRWFERAEVKAILAGTETIKAPPPIAIANRLIRNWVDAV